MILTESLENLLRHFIDFNKMILENLLRF